MNRELPGPLSAAEVGEGKGLGQVSIMRHRASLHPRVPKALRLRGQTASHRVAVGGTDSEGMYVLRRDTDSETGRVAGRFFPINEQGKARFRTRECTDRGEYSVKMDGDDAFVCVNAHEADSVNGSVFGSTERAEEFQRAEERSIEVSEKGLVDTRLSVNGSLQPLGAVETRSTVLEDFEGAEFDSAFVTKGGEYEWEPDVETKQPGI